MDQMILKAKTVEADRATYVEIERAKRGEAIIYHVGFLSPMNDNPSSRAAAEGHRSGAWRAYTHNLCALVQRRLEEFNFEYIAQRR